MIKMEVDMAVNFTETERLGRAMAVAARSKPEFIGSALAIWERANPGRSIEAELRCDQAQLWRLAVTPRLHGPGMPQAALALASSLGLNPLALVNMLRFAESANAFALANDDGEMLMAALDADNQEKDAD
ncbi:hypothetical protein IZ6_13000 [Terrihabitans soli]|uniref:Uncharacterized protein n=1 Tax=Terrihabitans soli TaxID=708113 RepID=A0A6S6QS81_9HYPH|nr:hypothetical protein [Terrihabitans soli]BCJ90565.1 hypothetical protein IZ6_13000 [Terrihabitans soli]